MKICMDRVDKHIVGKQKQKRREKQLKEQRLRKKSIEEVCLNKLFN